MGFEALMAVHIKITIFWGTCRFHLQVDYPEYHTPEDSNLHIQWMFENWINMLKYTFSAVTIILNIPISFRAALGYILFQTTLH
jgi:hypothetical protein